MLDALGTQTVGLGLAVALGFLVGLEREWSAHKPIGLRSFTLIGGAGGLAAMLGEAWGGWPVAAGLVAVSGLIIAHHLRHRPVPGEPEGGTTTMLAAVAVYLVGAACVAGYQLEGVVMAGVITVLLHGKQPLHGLVERIGQAEFNAVIRFVLITLVVLPVLPDRAFGPYHVLNPFQIWLLVVLIVALNLIGYVAFRLLSTHGSAVVGGVLGGLISSTATTVSFSTLTRDHRDLSAAAALIILIASTVVYGRVAVELLAVAPGLLPHAAGPMGAFAVVMLAAAAVMFPRVRRQRVVLPEQENPARLKVALTFAALYGVIIFTVAAARDQLGNQVIYVIAGISGLTDVDALTLSVGNLFAGGSVNADEAWRAIFLATLANLAFKTGAACVLGTQALRRYMLGLGGVALAAGVALLLLWP